MYNYKKLRKIHFNSSVIKFKKSSNIDISNWSKNPYTFLKARLFIEIAAIIVFFLQFTKITPNFVTGFYIFLGFLSGLFLASNNDALILTAVLLLIFKNIIDWCDGLLARIKKMTSNLGDTLDRWGSAVGYNSFVLGFGFYLYNESQNKYFIIIVILIMFLKSIDLKDYVYHLVGYKIFKDKNVQKILSSINIKQKSKNIIKYTKFDKYKNFIIAFLDDSRSRVVDTIAVLIFIDHFYINVNFLPYIFYFIFFKIFLFFLGGVYITCFRNYVFKK